MRYFLEYNIDTTRVQSVITSADDSEPQIQDGFALYEVSREEALNLDTSLIGVQDGKIINLYETPAERKERERLRREKREQSRQRAKAIRYEFFTALIEEDAAKMAELRSEYRALEAYL